MELVIQGIDDVTPEFINYLKVYLVSILLNSQIDFRRFNRFFKDNFKDITAEGIVILASVNILIFQCENTFIITINPNKLIDGTNMNLLEQCKFLNYGNLQIPGTHLFSDAFDYIAINFQDIYYQFMIGG